MTRKVVKRYSNGEITVIWQSALCRGRRRGRRRKSSAGKPIAGGFFPGRAV